MALLRKWVFMSLLTLSLSGCMLATQQVITMVVTATPDSLQSTTETSQEIVENPGSAINPLTGLPADPSTLQRRPFVVKISNAPPLVRPQSGISQADLVFEHYVEGGLTRFSAVFYSQAPERVGSIRSARLIDYELVPMYQALFAFSGASTGVEDLLYNHSEFAERTYKGVLYGQPYYWRDESIEIPHNMFTNLQQLWNLASEEGLNTTPSLQGMAFSPELPSNSLGTVRSLDVFYRATRVRWEYDPAISGYRRWSDGESHLDANTGDQITAANVVILYASHTLTDIVESEWQGNISYSIQIQLWFEGDALVFRDGQSYSARWSRPTRESLITLQAMDGQSLPLKPGNTWFQVMPLLEQQNSNQEGINTE